MVEGTMGLGVENAKDVVKSAIGFVEELYPSAKDIRLEEVEPLDNEWSVVLSFVEGEDSVLSSVMREQSRHWKLWCLNRLLPFQPSLEMGGD
jgi:hypothetical protein